MENVFDDHFKAAQVASMCTELCIRLLQSVCVHSIGSVFLNREITAQYTVDCVIKCVRVCVCGSESVHVLFLVT